MIPRGKELNEFLIIVLLISLFLGFFVSLLVLYLLDSRVYDGNGKRLPGPNHHLWGQNYLYIRRLARQTNQYSKVISEIFLKEVGDGNIVAFRKLFSRAPSLIIAHPDMVKHVVTGHQLKFLKDAKWDRMKDILGEGLVTCDERLWPRFRSALMPIFRSKSLKGMMTVFNIHSRRLLRHWHFRLNKVALEQENYRFIKCYLDQDIRSLMTGVMCEAGFGYDFFTKSKSKRVSEDLEIIIEEYLQRMSEPMHWWSRMFSNRRTHVNKAVNNFKDLLYTALVERIEQAKVQGDNSPNTVNESSMADEDIRGDFLQLLLDANEVAHDYHRLSNQEICDHVFTFILLGYESTASTLTWMIYELCMHPAIQEQCAAEVDSVLNVNGVLTSAVIFEDISKFSVLIQVLKETMRLHPPLPMIIRKCTTACKIGKYSMQPGSEVSISLLALHRHPDFWYLPNEFFPQRFAPENISETIKSPYQYIPFGGGPRNCIGQRFGQMSVIVILAVLLSKYSFSLEIEDEEKIRFVENVCYAPSEFRVKVSFRNQYSVDSSPRSTGSSS